MKYIVLYETAGPRGAVYLYESFTAMSELPEIVKDIPEQRIVGIYQGPITEEPKPSATATELSGAVEELRCGSIAERLLQFDIELLEARAQGLEEAALISASSGASYEVTMLNQ